MPFEHLVDEDLRLVTVRGPGPLEPGTGASETEESIGRLLRDPRIGPGYRLLIVIGDDAPALAPEEVLRIDELVQLLRLRVSGPIAIAVSGVGRATAANLIALRSDDPSTPVRVFLGERAAREWLLAHGPDDPSTG